MEWTITSKKFAGKTSDGSPAYIVEILADELAALPVADPSWKAGSFVMFADDTGCENRIVVLNSEGQWK